MKHQLQTNEVPQPPSTSSCPYTISVGENQKSWGRDGGGYNESKEGKRFTHGANINNYREAIHGIKELGVLIYTYMHKEVI